MANEDLMKRIDDFQRCIDARDAALAAEVLDGDYALVLVHPVSVVMRRDRWLDVLDDYLVHDYVVQEVLVDVDGDCAAVIQKVEMSATVLGEDRSGIFVISDFWRRRDGDWRVWRRHSTPLSAGTMPGVPNA